MGVESSRSCLLARGPAARHLQVFEDDLYLSLCQRLVRRRSRVRPYDLHCSLHCELARSGAWVIQFRVGFLRGGVVKRVVRMRGNPRLGVDFPPYWFLPPAHGKAGVQTLCVMLLKSIDDDG